MSDCPRDLRREAKKARAEKARDELGPQIERVRQVVRQYRVLLGDPALEDEKSDRPTPGDGPPRKR